MSLYFQCVYINKGNHRQEKKKKKASTMQNVKREREVVLLRILPLAQFVYT